MKKNLVFVVFYQKTNIYSFNALIAAIETEQRLNDIEICFIRGKEPLIKKLDQLIHQYRKIVVGISFFTTQIWKISQLVKTLRKKFHEKIFLIAGGPHPTGDPEGALRIGFDLVIVGEGEETLIEILLKIKASERIDSSQGIAFLNDKNDYIYTGKRAFIDLDKYPPLPIKNVKFGAIEITRGCPFACYFCQTPYIFGTKPRHRSIESICNAVRFMKQFNKLDIRFISPSIFSYGSVDGISPNLSKLKDLLRNIKEIIKPNGRIFLGSFPSEVRPEHVNEETLSLLKQYAINDNIIIGAQSGSNRILDLCHRGHSVDEIYKAVELIINFGYIANVDFIFGLPNENEKDINLTIQTIKDLTNIGAKIHLHYFIPLPQTPFMKAQPSKLNKKLEDLIKDLNSKGLLYGNWKYQSKIAEKIYNYFKKIRIKSKIS